MKLRVLAYGHSRLREACRPVREGGAQLERLIADMWATMYGANGCGLAAPQVDVPIQLFLVDSLQTFEAMDSADRAIFFENDSGIRETFINARILWASERSWTDEEGCLSIPGITIPVRRPWSIRLQYHDTQFRIHRREFSGLSARMIQHELDHTLGKLHLDHLGPLSRRMLEKKLGKIASGGINPGYPMLFPRGRRG